MWPYAAYAIKLSTCVAHLLAFTPGEAAGARSQRAVRAASGFLVSDVGFRGSFISVPAFKGSFVMAGIALLAHAADEKLTPLDNPAAPTARDLRRWLY